MFIAMNRFQVNEGKESAFEEMWRNRETYLDEVPGFVSFALLRNWIADDDKTTSTSRTPRGAPGRTSTPGRNSETFKRGHAQGSVQGILAGHPVVSLYETVLSRRRARSRPA